MRALRIRNENNAYSARLGIRVLPAIGFFYRLFEESRVSHGLRLHISPCGFCCFYPLTHLNLNYPRKSTGDDPIHFKGPHKARRLCEPICFVKP